MLLISSTEDVGLNVIRVLIHVIHLIQEAGRKDILQPYVKVSVIQYIQHS